MDLHYSQTLFLFVRPFFLFHYLMDLHYSQTRFYKKTKNAGFTTLWIYTILKRNSSCTLFRACFTTLWIYTILKLFPLPVATAIVSLPYGFTLFSNTVNGFKFCQHVSLPYGFTLFSNFIITLKLKLSVSLPYGFTLFSNG